MREGEKGRREIGREEGREGRRGRKEKKSKLR